MANTKSEGEIVRARGAGSKVLQILARWAFVGLPLGWGVFVTLKKAVQLFQ
jgi:hypothetical protein